jgi:hypothetical protein
MKTPMTALTSGSDFLSSYEPGWKRFVRIPALCSGRLACAGRSVRSPDRQKRAPEEDPSCRATEQEGYQWTSSQRPQWLHGGQLAMEGGH